MNKATPSIQVPIRTRSQTTSKWFQMPNWQTTALLSFCLLANQVDSLSAADASASASGQSVPGKNLIESAHQLYQSALQEQTQQRRSDLFRRSAEGFGQAISSIASAKVGSGTSPGPSPELWVAYGNAALESEQIGKAIFAYRNALKVSPNARNASQNLAFARTRVSGGFSAVEKPFLRDTLFFWHNSVSQRQQTAIAAALFGFAGLLVVLSVVLRQRWPFFLALLPAALWGILLFSAISGRSQQDLAAVVLEEAVLRSADTELAQPRIKQPIPDGTEVRLLETREDWCEIETRGQTGWLKTSQIGRLDQ